MKNTLSALVLIGFLGVLLVPLFVSAQEAPKECCTMKRSVTIENKTCAAGQVAAPDSTWVGATTDKCAGTAWCLDELTKGQWGMFCLLNTLYSITDWIFVILVGLAGIFVIIGAMTLLMAAGNPEKVTSGRNYILYAAIGLIVGLLAKVIPSLVRMIAGM